MTTANQPTICYIGLGGNISNELGTPSDHIANAVKAFEQHAAFDGVRVSSLYHSKAYGVTDQPDFVNAVLLAHTTLSPIELLDFCQSLEQDAGRVRLRRWGERSLDVDVLLYGDQRIENERLTVPHRELTLRNFVLIPLLELTPDLVVDGQDLAQLPAASDWTSIEKSA